MRSEKQRKETGDLLDRVMQDGYQQAINWLRGAFFTHEENIHSLKEDMQDLICLALNSIHRPLTVKEAQLLMVCRICRGGFKAPFILVLNFGDEYAHQKCLDRERETNSSQVLPVFPTLTGEF